MRLLLRGAPRVLAEGVGWEMNDFRGVTFQPQPLSSEGFLSSGVKQTAYFVQSCTDNPPEHLSDVLFFFLWFLLNPVPSRSCAHGSSGFVSCQAKSDNGGVTFFTNLWSRPALLFGAETFASDDNDGAKREREKEIGRTRQKPKTKRRSPSPPSLLKALGNLHT